MTKGVLYGKMCNTVWYFSIYSTRYVSHYRCGMDLPKTLNDWLVFVAMFCPVLPNPIFSTGNSLLLVSSGSMNYMYLDITYTTTDQGIFYGNKSTCCGLGNVVHLVLRTTVMSVT